jgi:hypothetical protein
MAVIESPADHNISESQRFSWVVILAGPRKVDQGVGFQAITLAAPSCLNRSTTNPQVGDPGVH